MNLKNKKMIWLHYNQLNTAHDIFKHVADYDAILFIWDDAYFESLYFSNQRLYFIWQCLADFKLMNLKVIKGDTDAVLKSLYKKNPQIQIFTPENPVFSYQRWQFVEPLKQNQFIVYDKSVPFGFFKFWKTAQQQLFG